jgi:hypothetical protein
VRANSLPLLIASTALICDPCEQALVSLTRPGKGRGQKAWCGVSAGAEESGARLSVDDPSMQRHASLQLPPGRPARWRDAGTEGTLGSPRLLSAIARTHTLLARDRDRDRGRGRDDSPALPSFVCFT